MATETETTRGPNQSSRGLGLAPADMADAMEEEAREGLPAGAFEEALRIAEMMADQQ